jgi:formylglycine-generating enzyme required for sulfatase activity
MMTLSPRLIPVRLPPVVLFFLLLNPADAAESREASDMSRVPAGIFLMGSNDGPEDERPQHKVNLREFFIDRNQVTNSQFAGFLNALGPQGTGGKKYYDIDDNDARIHRRENKWMADSGHENRPVVESSWFGARAYCAWAGQTFTDRSGVGKGGAWNRWTQISLGKRAAGRRTRPF